MKKKIIIGVCVLLALILLMPIPMRLKDGGTVEYRAVLYSVSDVHRLASTGNDVVFEDGIIIEVFGVEIFNNVQAPTFVDVDYDEAYVPTEGIQPGGNAVDDWGLHVSAADVTPSGLKFVISHSGNIPFASFGYGSHYWIEQYNEGEWKSVEFAPQEYDVAWTTELHFINIDDITNIGINWEWLYGKLPAGQYRVGKVIDNLTNSSNFETRTYYVEFKIDGSEPKNSNEMPADTIEGNLKTCYEMSDQTQLANDYTYKYRLQIKGIVPNAAKEPTFVYLSNLENIAFDQAWKAAGLSSNLNDYFFRIPKLEASVIQYPSSSLEDAMLVKMK